MNFLTKFFWIFIFFFLFLGGSSWAAEPEDPYSPSLYSRSGQKISAIPGSLKWILAPDTVYKNFPNQKSPYFTINSVGFRGAEVSKTHPAGRRRIIFVGGSACFGHGATDPETFEAILQEKAKGYEIINAGVGAFVSLQQLCFLVTELVDYSPDMVIAYNGWNDLLFMQMRGAGYPFSQLEKELVEAHQHLRKKDHKDEVIKNVPPLPKNNQEYFDLECRNYTRNLIKMSRICRAWGIKFLVVFQPELGNKKTLSPEETILLKKNTKRWPDKHEKIGTFPIYYKKFIEYAKKEMKKNGIPYLDINVIPGFTNSPKHLFIDDVHTNKTGNEIIASILKDHLAGR